MPKDDLLFSRGRLSAALEQHSRKMTAFADDIAPAHVLSSSEVELAAELMDEYTVKPVELDWDKLEIEQDEADVDVSGDPLRVIHDRSKPFNLKGTTISFRVPFEGDRDLFFLTPSRFTLDPPRGRIEGDELVFSVTSVGLTSEAVSRVLDVLPIHVVDR